MCVQWAASARQEGGSATWHSLCTANGRSLPMTVTGEQACFVLLSSVPFQQAHKQLPQTYAAFKAAKGCCDEEILVHFNQQVLNKQKNYH